MGERSRGIYPAGLLRQTLADAVGLAAAIELSEFGLCLRDLQDLKNLFEHATTFGSLIQVPAGLLDELPALVDLAGSDKALFSRKALEHLMPLVQQAELLAA